MARRRHEVGGSGRKPGRPNGGGRPKAARRPRRRRGFMARANERTVALTVLVAAGIAIGGVAITGAVTGGSTTPVAATTPSPATSVTPSPSASGPLGPVAPTPTATPTATPAAPSPTAHPKTPSPSPTPSPTAVAHSVTPTPAASSCPPASDRVAAARKLLQHADALPDVTLITAGPRQGLLGNADASAKTVTLYVRGCADEPTLQLASVWAYEAGQFVPVQLWDSAKQSKWEQLRGSGNLSYNETKQDAAAVFMYWQTGSTRYWNSPVAPPAFSQLSKLAPFLTFS